MKDLVVHENSLQSLDRPFPQLKHACIFCSRHTSSVNSSFHPWCSAWLVFWILLFWCDTMLFLALCHQSPNPTNLCQELSCYCPQIPHTCVRGCPAHVRPVPCFQASLPKEDHSIKLNSIIVQRVVIKSVTEYFTECVHKITSWHYNLIWPLLVKSDSRKIDFKCPVLLGLAASPSDFEPVLVSPFQNRLCVCVCVCVRSLPKHEFIRKWNK